MTFSFPFSLMETIVIVFCSWWMILYCTLPFGIQADEDALQNGCDAGAPKQHHLKLKAIITTGLTLLLYILLCVIKILF